MSTKQLPGKPLTTDGSSNDKLCHYPKLPVLRWISPYKALCGAALEDFVRHGAHCEVCVVCAELAPVPHP